MWFDGANPKPGTGQTYTYGAWYEMIYELAPGAAIFGKGPDARWCGNEGGCTREDEYNVIPLVVSPDEFDWPDMTEANIAGWDMIIDETSYFHYYPAETNTSIRHGWFWRNDDEQQVRSADAFRLTITEARLEPSLAHISAHYYDEPPKPVVIRRDSEGMVEMGLGLSFEWNHHGMIDLSQPVIFLHDDHLLIQ